MNPAEKKARALRDARTPIVGVDLGGTKIIAAAIYRGRILNSVTVPTLPDLQPAGVVRGKAGERAVFAQLQSAIDHVCRTLEKKGQKPSGIGIGSPGPLDIHKGLILRAPNIPVVRFPVISRVESLYGIPAVLENDANCLALGEALFGKGAHHRIVAGVILGTGVGAGLVIDGELYHGRGNACEFGHISIAAGPGCTCGNRGCLEEYASGRAVTRIARELGLVVSSAKEVSQIADGRGRPAKLARKAYGKMGEMLGLGLANITHAVDPEIIVLAGGVSGASRHFLSAARKVLRAKYLVSPPPVRVGAGRSALLGAASLVLSSL